MTEEVRMARGAALATAAAAPVALGLAWYAAGSKGLLGAAFGLALAVAFLMRFVFVSQVIYRPRRTGRHAVGAAPIEQTVASA